MSFFSMVIKHFPHLLPCAKHHSFCILPFKSIYEHDEKQSFNDGHKILVIYCSNSPYPVISFSHIQRILKVEPFVRLCSTPPPDYLSSQDSLCVFHSNQNDSQFADVGSKHVIVKREACRIRIKRSYHGRLDSGNLFNDGLVPYVGTDEYVSA